MNARTRNASTLLWGRLRLLGTTRLRLALLFAAIAATTLTMLTTLPAHADPSPTPSPSTSASVPADGAQRPPTPEEMKRIEDLLREQGERISAAAQQEMIQQRTDELRKLLPHEGGILGAFNVTDSNGMPISAYTIKGDTGGLLDWDLGIENLLTEIPFMITKWVIAFCCFLIGWALSFGLAKILLPPVAAVANSLHTGVILEMGLPSVFLAVCALICVARIFFGDRAKGWGDAAMSVVLAALTTTLLASAPQTLMGEDSGAIAVVRGMAVQVADVILEANPGTPHRRHDLDVDSTTLTRPLTDALVDAFVVKPAMLLQYGQVFQADCADEYSKTKLSQLAYDRQMTSYANRLKAATFGLTSYLPAGSGPLNTWYGAEIDVAKRWAVDHFGDPPMEKFEKKCVKGDVGSAKRASIDKVGGALFLLVAALIVTVLISGLTGSFLLAQCRIAWDAVRGEMALVAGTVPGAGRTFLWDWCASVLRSLQMMLTSVIGLSVFIVFLQAVLTPAGDAWGHELTLRFLGVDLLCIAAVKKRKQLVARSQQVANNFRAKMSSRRIGGTGNSILTPAATPVTRRPRIAAATARGLVRTTMAGVALAHGNPLAAIGYAMPRSVGATALMSRINAGSRRSPQRSRRPVRPAGRPMPRPGRTGPPGTGPQATRPLPSGPTAPPRPTNPPRPTVPPTPARRPAHRRAADPIRGSRPRAATIQPANRAPNRAVPGAFSAWLDEREAAELARRRTPPRDSA